MNVQTELLIAVAIIGSMVLQFGEHRVTWHRLLAPVAIVIGFAVFYLKAIPTSGNDGLFTLVGVTLGIVLGALAAALMRVGRDTSGRRVTKAGLAYVSLWTVVFGGRLAFALVATNSPETLRQLFIWTYQHGITQTGWTAFLMLQAIAMVGLRTVVVWARIALVGAFYRRDGRGSRIGCFQGRDRRLHRRRSRCMPTGGRATQKNGTGTRPAAQRRPCSALMTL